MSGFPGPRANPYRPHHYDQAVSVEPWCGWEWGTPPNLLFWVLCSQHDDKPSSLGVPNDQTNPYGMIMEQNWTRFDWFWQNFGAGTHIFLLFPRCCGWRQSPLYCMVTNPEFQRACYCLKLVVAHSLTSYWCKTSAVSQVRLQHFTTHNQARSSGGHLPRWVPVKGPVHDKTTSCITQEECTMALQSVLVDAIICSWADFFIGNVFHGCRVCNPICPINCSQNPSDEHVSDKPGVYVRSSTRDYVCVCFSICFLYIYKPSCSNLLCITYIPQAVHA